MKKKLIIGMSLACAAILASTTALTLTHNKMLTAKAGGNERTLIFNEDSEITFSNNTATASEGNMRLYCDYGFDMGQGMFLTASGSSHYFGVYYNEIVGGGYNVYQGFNEATVTSVTIRYKTTNGQNVYLCWGNLKEDKSEMQFYGDATTEFTMYGSEFVREDTIAAGDFFTNQEAAKSSIYRAIAIRGSHDVYVYGVTVNFTCK